MNTCAICASFIRSTTGKRKIFPEIPKIFFAFNNSETILRFNTKHLLGILITASNSFSSFSFCPQPYNETERVTAPFCFDLFFAVRGEKLCEAFYRPENNSGGCNFAAAVGFHFTLPFPLRLSHGCRGWRAGSRSTGSPPDSAASTPRPQARGGGASPACRPA